MALDTALTEGPNWWTLPPTFEEQWKTLVRTFGLVEDYPDEPLGNGVLRTPKKFSDEQAKVLVDVLKLKPETVPVPPGSYSERTLPWMSVQVLEGVVGVYERVHPPFGLTIEVKGTINRLMGRQWTQLPTSYFLPKEIRETARLAENERLAAITEALKTRPLADLVGEMLGVQPGTPVRGLEIEPLRQPGRLQP